MKNSEISLNNNRPENIMSWSIHVVLILTMLAIMSSGLMAQSIQEVGKEKLTRGKFWYCGIPNGSLEKESEMSYIWQSMYPGHWSARNEAAGGWDRSRVFNGSVLGGYEVGWEYRNQWHPGDIYAVQDSNTQLHQNYNFVNSINEPEEYITGTIKSYQYDSQSQRHMQYDLEGKVMVWSLPAYDDFIIIKCKLTNTDNITFNDFYYARYLEPRGPYNPLNTDYDVEYIWDDEVSPELGFIFYDDTEWSPITGDSTIYDEFPGTVTGDRGDPGNIKTQNSLDKALYSPSLYAFSFIDITPNKNGEERVWRNIYSRSSSAPAEDDYPGSDILTTWQGLSNAFTSSQPEISWREANSNYQVGDYAGSLWERNPRYMYGIGPYDIAPGESIEWVEVFVCGAMDRNISILGGLEATQNYLSEGLINIRDNWQAARELIDNNFVIPGKIPPPTPADVPTDQENLDNTDYLLYSTSSQIVDGIEIAGINLTWNAVHENYTDPITGIDDFQAYIIYRSNYSVEGPWVAVDTILVDDFNSLTQGGKVQSFVPAGVNIPYYYLVTSIDKDGNECGRTAYSHYPIAAKTFSTNNMKSIVVVPNPFRQESGLTNPLEDKRLAFLNIPEKCTIRIYTIDLDLVREIKHDGGGEETWGTYSGNDYMLTNFAMNVSPGVYIYQVENLVEGFKGEMKPGKFIIIK
jgi:hypothetical protein